MTAPPPGSDRPPPDTAARRIRATTLAALALCLILVGCTQNMRRFVAPGSWVTPESRHPDLAEVVYVSGLPGDTWAPWAPAQTETVEGMAYSRPPTIASDGTIRVTPLVPGTRIRVLIRNTGRVEGPFQPVWAVSGTLPGKVHTELRFLDTRPAATWELPVEAIANVYNGYRLQDGDLLLIEITGPDDRVERYLFRHREFGLRVKAGANVLLRVAAPGQPAPEVGLSPALALSLAFGYRFRSQHPVVEWLGNRVGVVVSVGIGSTAIPTVTARQDVAERLDGAFNAALAGGGLELYDFVSVQVLANASALLRDRQEHGWTLAIGFDAVQFTRFTQDAGTRLFRKNRIPVSDDTPW